MTTATNPIQAATEATLRAQHPELTDDQVAERMQKAFPTPKKELAWYQGSTAKTIGIVGAGVGVAALTGYFGYRMGRTKGREEGIAACQAPAVVEVHDSNMADMPSATVTPIPVRKAA